MWGGMPNHGGSRKSPGHWCFLSNSPAPHSLAKVFGAMDPRHFQVYQQRMFSGGLKGEGTQEPRKKKKTRGTPAGGDGGVHCDHVLKPYKWHAQSVFLQALTLLSPPEVRSLPWWLGAVPALALAAAHAPAARACFAGPYEGFDCCPWLATLALVTDQRIWVLARLRADVAAWYTSWTQRKGWELWVTDLCWPDPATRSAGDTKKTHRRTEVWCCYGRCEKYVEVLLVLPLPASGLCLLIVSPCFPDNCWER